MGTLAGWNASGGSSPATKLSLPATRSFLASFENSSALPTWDRSRSEFGGMTNPGFLQVKKRRCGEL